MGFLGILGLRRECKLILKRCTTKKGRYTEEFKREAVKLVTEYGYSLAEVARSLGIHTNLSQQLRRKFAHENMGTEIMSESECANPNGGARKTAGSGWSGDILKSDGVFLPAKIGKVFLIEAHKECVLSV